MFIIAFVVPNVPNALSVNDFLWFYYVYIVNQSFTSVTGWKIDNRGFFGFLEILWQIN